MQAISTQVLFLNIYTNTYILKQRFAMKKLASFFAGTFLILLSLASNAQEKSNADYFAGKWNVLVAGTPNGDAKMVINLSKKDTTLSGTVLDTGDTEIAKISKIEPKGKSLTVYFTAQGYDVYLVMNRKDEDHVTGTLMDMFDAKGDRIKEGK